MPASILPENEPQIHPRNPYPRPGPVPDWRLDALYYEAPPSLVVRDESSTSPTPAATSCGKNDNSGACEKYYGASGSDTTLPIVLGVVIPLGIAVIVLIYLQRRHVKRLRREDADDRHKSLDFGLGEGKQRPGVPRAKKLPEMSLADEKEIGLRRGRGMSLDLGTHNPYLLPPELQNSRESLHSLSRLNTGEDRYRPTDFIPDDGSIRSPSIRGSPHDDSSSYTASSSRRFQPDQKPNLLPNGALAPGLSIPTDSSAGARKPVPLAKNSAYLAPAPHSAARDSTISTASSNGAVNALRASNNYLGQFISGGTAPANQGEKKEPTTTVKEVKVDSPIVHVQAPPPALVKDSPPTQHAVPVPPMSDQPISSDSTLNSPTDRQPRLPQLSFIDSEGHKRQSLLLGEYHQPEPTASNTTSHYSTTPSTDVAGEPRHVSTTPSQVHAPGQPHEEAEDYYDEYEEYADNGPHYYDDQYYQEFYDHQEQMGYDPRRSMMGMRPLPPDDPSENPEDRANRIRSFYKEYFDESKHPGPSQPMQYYDGAEGYYDNYDQGNYPEEYYDQAAYYPPRGMSQNGAYGRHRATISNGSYHTGPRAFSSASGRYAAPRMAPKKKLPPPKALNVLPTPHKLKEDTFLPIDFAPPKKFQNQRAGTPDSLRGGLRPYSPTVRAHIPLASSFDDLAVIPSP
jgi:hypothetical protein